MCVSTLLDNLVDLFDLDENGCVQVSRGYSVKKNKKYTDTGENYFKWPL